MNLSIIGNPMEESIGRRSRQERKEDRKKRREERKASGKPSRVKKVLLAIPRGAFLGLILLNVRGLAGRLSEMSKKDPAKVKAMWLRLGGDPKKLLENIEKGAKKKRILGDDEFRENSIGFAVPAALASAAPILVVINKFLKDNNIKILPGESLDDIKPEPGTEIDTNTAAADAETPEAAAKQPTQAGSSTPETRGESGFKFTPTTGLIIGAVVIGGFLLMKKKK
jgi:hypothetical protein